MERSTIDALRAVPLFAELDDEALGHVVEIAAPVEHPHGAVLIERGTPGSGLFVIMDGTVGIELRHRTVEAGPGETVGELSLLTDHAARVARVLAVTDVGPYQLGESALPKWDDVLIGDKFYCFLAIRIATYGSDYEFKTQCGACRASFPWALKLDELPVKRLNAEDAEAFRSGVPLLAKVPSDGREVKFRLSLGKDERIAAKARTTENALVKMMSLRILELDGDADRNKIQAFLDDCNLDDLTKLLKGFDARDCGVETSLDVECPECFHRHVVTLPLGLAFWLPN